MRIPHETLRQRITIENYLGTGARGPTFADPVPNVMASVQTIEDARVDWKDSEILVRVMAIVRPEVGKDNVKVGSRITVDDEVYRVVKRIPIPDWRMPSHIELMLMSWGSE